MGLLDHRGTERQEMKGILFNRRGFTLALTTVLLAGCAVVPKGPTAPPPPQGPDETALPTDDARHRIALLVPMTGGNGNVGQ